MKSDKFCPIMTAGMLANPNYSERSIETFVLKCTDRCQWAVKSQPEKKATIEAELFCGLIDNLSIIATEIEQK